MDFLIPVIVVTAVAGAAYWYFFLRKKKEQTPSAPLPVPTGSVVVPMEAVKWNITHGLDPSITQPVKAATGWSFDFPVGLDLATEGTVNYVTVPMNTNITGKTSIDMTYDIVTSGDPVFQYKLGDPANVCDNPAGVSLYIERIGNDGTADTQFHRWFSVPQSNLMAGKVDFSVPLKPENWLSVFGKKGDEVPLEFAAALTQVKSVGMVFGGGCFKGHGVNIDKGEAKFNCMTYEVK